MLRGRLKFVASAALSVYLDDRVDLADKQHARHKPDGACVRCEVCAV